MALWIVATPLGSLGDLSPRAQEKLGEVAVIAAEDTRTTRRLLTASGIAAPELVALHAHNEDGLAERLATRALHEEVALVCDAGTPGISDPGTPLVAAAHQLGVKIWSVPGPSALPSALAASGLPAIPSTFLGFPPRKQRREWVEASLKSPHTLVVYESPHRVAELVGLYAEAAPQREAVLCREISKRFEEIVRARLPDLAANLSAREEILGECVVVIGPGAVFEAGEAPEVGRSLKEIAAALAERWEVPPKEAYRALVALENARKGEG